jgi:hypothetical protein
MCVTPAGKIGNVPVACRNCCHIRAKKAAFFTPPASAKIVSFHFLSLTMFPDGGSGVVNFEVFTPCDLIAAITQHILDKSFQRALLRVVF